MLETTHVLTALALAGKVQNPFLAFGVGFVSHLVLDAIPHYDFRGRILKPEYHQKENTCYGKKELSRTGKIVICSDIAVSFLVFLYLSVWGPLWPDFPKFSSLFANLYWHLPWVTGVLGGIFPDVMNLIGFKTGFYRPKWFFEFHKNIQLPEINPVAGLTFQVILVLFCIYVFVK